MPCRRLLRRMHDAMHTQTAAKSRSVEVGEETRPADALSLDWFAV